MEDFLFHIGNGEIVITDEVTDNYVASLIEQDNFWETVSSLLHQEAHRVSEPANNPTLDSINSKLTQLLELTENLQQTGIVSKTISEPNSEPVNEIIISSDIDEDGSEDLSLDDQSNLGDLGSLLQGFNQFT